MPRLSGSNKLICLTLVVVTFCAIWTYATESLRSRRTVSALQRVSASDVTAIYIEGRTVADPAAVSAILQAIQHTRWHTFERNYAQERHRLILSFRKGYPWMIDVRPLHDGSSVVQVLRRDGLAEQRETVMASGDSPDLWPMVQRATAKLAQR